MLTIGLTGGIGSGKSEVARFLEQFGAVLINADQVGHEVYTPSTDGWREVVAAFGEQVLGPGGQIDRKKLGPIVFSDPTALAKLNAITHPRIYKAMETRLNALRAKGVQAAVVEAAILIEANWTPLVDEVWVVIAPEDTIIQRVKARSNLPESEIRRRLRSQLSPEQRRQHADIVIENTGSLEDLRRQVEKLWSQRVQPHVV